jgi:hypothetical protein
MRNTAGVTGGKHIAVLSESISDANPLVAFYDIHGRNGGVFILARIPGETSLSREIDNAFQMLLVIEFLVGFIYLSLQYLEWFLLAFYTHLYPFAHTR